MAGITRSKVILEKRQKNIKHFQARNEHGTDGAAQPGDAGGVVSDVNGTCLHVTEGPTSWLGSDP